MPLITDLELSTSVARCTSFNHSVIFLTNLRIGAFWQAPMTGTDSKVGVLSYARKVNLTECQFKYRVEHSFMSPLTSR